MTFKYRNHLKSMAVVICVVFITSILIGQYVELFRFDKNLRWVYEAGKSFSFWTFILAPLIGLVNGLWIMADKQIKRKDYFVWTILSLAPISYLVIMMTYSVLKPLE